MKPKSARTFDIFRNLQAAVNFKYLSSLLALIIWLAGPRAIPGSEITPAGKQLAAVLDSLHEDQLWLSGRQVNWRTGEPTGKFYTNTTAHTHCSAFAASAAETLGVHLLRPPEHSAVLLANAQQDWLCSRGTNEGWYQVASPLRAQQLANGGQLVLVSCKNHDPQSTGHIAIVRPSNKSDADILADGPQVIQAGAQNYMSTTVKEGFKHHPGAFERQELMYFAHAVSFPAVSPSK